MFAAPVVASDPGKYDENSIGRFRIFSITPVRSTVTNERLLLLPKVAMSLPTSWDMTQEAFRFHRSGRAFQTLLTSVPEKVPSVVVTTSTLVFASRAVRMPRKLVLT